MANVELQSGLGPGLLRVVFERYPIVQCGCHRAKDAEADPRSSTGLSSQGAPHQGVHAAPLQASRGVKRGGVLEGWTGHVSGRIHRYGAFEIDNELAEWVVMQVVPQ